MKIKLLAVSMMLASFVHDNPETVLATQSKVIELNAKEGGSKIATIRVNDQSVLLEITNNSDTFLFSPEAFFTISSVSRLQKG